MDKYSVLPKIQHYSLYWVLPMEVMGKQHLPYLTFKVEYRLVWVKDLD